MLPTVFKLKIENREAKVNSSSVLLDNHHSWNSQEHKWMKTRIEECHEKQAALHYHNSNSVENDLNGFSHQIEIPWEISIQAHQDVLARCLISGTVGWLRIPMNASLSDEADTDSVKLSEQHDYSVSNLKVSTTHPNGVKLLLMSNNSAVKKISYSDSLGHRNTPITPHKASLDDANKVSVLMRGKISEYSSLGALLRTPQLSNSIQNFNGCEFSAKLVVVDWFGMEKENEDNPFAISNLRIICMDQSRYSVELNYPILTKMYDKITWLKKNTQILIQRAHIVEVDTVFEILRITRNDHTNVDIVSSYVVPKIHSAHDSASDVKRRRFSTPQVNRKNVVTPSSLQSSVVGEVNSQSTVELDGTFLEDERMRIRAMRTNQTFFQSVSCGRILSCKKLVVMGSMEILSDQYEGIFFIEGFEWAVLKIKTKTVATDLVPYNSNISLHSTLIYTAIERKYVTRYQNQYDDLIFVLQSFLEPISGTFDTANVEKIDYFCVLMVGAE